MDKFKQANNKYMTANDLNTKHRPQRGLRRLKRIANKIARKGLVE